MKSQYSWLKILSSLDENNCSQPEINSLIEHLFSISFMYLQFIHKKVYRLLEREEIQLKDLAIDAIVNLFEKDSEGKFHNLINPFVSWQPKIETEEDASYFLNKIAAKRVEQHISFLLRDSDPFFSKILDSINYLIQKEGYNKLNYRGTSYIVEGNYQITNGSLISSDDIYCLPSDLLKEKREMLSKLFNYIKEETKFLPAIPVNALVLRLKTFNSEFSRNNSINESITENIDIELIINNALETTFSKLKVSYLDKSKINNTEAELIKKALIDMTNDLRDGGIIPGLFKYLQAHFTALNKKEYQEKYHNMIEYLFKVLKKSVAEQLVGG